MASTKKPRKPLAECTLPEIRNRLLKRGYTLELAHRFVERIRAKRKAEKNRKVKDATIQRLWGEVITPMSKEMSNTLVGAKYASDQGDALRAELYRQYHAAMVKVRSELYKYRRLSGQTPASMAAERNKQLERDGRVPYITNNGAHWVDWVPLKVREAFAQEFDRLHHRPHARVKIPFQRMIPPDIWAQKFVMLSQEMTKEYDTLLARYEIYLKGNSGEGRNDFDDAPHKRIKARMDLILQARGLLDRFPRGECLPNTWHGLFPAYKRDEAMRIIVGLS